MLSATIGVPDAGLGNRRPCTVLVGRTPLFSGTITGSTRFPEARIRARMETAMLPLHDAPPIPADLLPRLIERMHAAYLNPKPDPEPA